MNSQPEGRSVKQSVLVLRDTLYRLEGGRGLDSHDGLIDSYHFSIETSLQALCECVLSLMDKEAKSKESES